MTKGFTIDILLSDSNKKNKNSDKKKNEQSNFYKNLSYHAFSPGDLSFFSSDPNKGLCYNKTSSPICLPTANNCTSLNKSSSIIAPHAKQAEGFRPPHGSHTPTWPQSATNHIPVHKKGQVEATRKSKPRKTQTVFSQHQLRELETKYNNSNYISSEEREEIARHLGMTVPQVKNWFQNKRNKERKMGHNPNRNSLHLSSGPYGPIGGARGPELARGLHLPSSMPLYRY